MSRFYFNVINSSGYLQDEEGEELANIAAARAAAVQAVRSILSEECKEGQVDLRGRIEVTDAERATLITLPFSEAVEVRTGPPPSDAVPGADG